MPQSVCRAHTCPDQSKISSTNSVVSTSARTPCLAGVMRECLRPRHYAIFLGVPSGAVSMFCQGGTMTRGSRVFKPSDVPESNASRYPEPFREAQRKRYNRRLGDHGGLKNYGVNLIRVLPGGESSARHAHSE